MGLKDRLKEIRDIKNISKYKLSKNTGIAERTISSYERGERKPSITYIEELCKITNANSNWLITGQGEIFLDEQSNNTYNINHDGDNNILNGKNYGKINIHSNDNSASSQLKNNLHKEIDKLSTKKQEYFYYLIKAENLKEEG